METADSPRNVDTYPVSYTVSHARRLHLIEGLCGFNVHSLVCHWTLKKEAARSSETSVDFYGTTQRHIPDDDALRFFFCSL
jgi:hypothetical protein